MMCSVESGFCDVMCSDGSGFCDVMCSVESGFCDVMRSDDMPYISMSEVVSCELGVFFGEALNIFLMF